MDGWMDGWMDVHTINDLHFSSINDSLCNSGSLIYVLVPKMFSSEIIFLLSS